MAKSFLEAVEVLETDALSYLDYHKMKENHAELPTTRDWDLDFITTPNAVYMPSPEIIKARLTGVTLNANVQLADVKANLRGFTVRQSVRQGTSEGTVTLTFVDREDRSISAWLYDWADKMGTRDQRFAFRKEDTICDIKFSILNSSRLPVQEIILYTCQISGSAVGTLNLAYNSDDAKLAGDITMTIAFEHYDLIWANQ